MKTLFAGSESKLVSDTIVYQEWFAKADEKTQRLAVGSKRFDLMREIGGPRPDWAAFIDPETGELLSHAEIKTEGKRARERRINKVQAGLAQRRASIAAIQTYGFLMP